MFGMSGCSGVSTPGPKKPEKKRFDGLTVRVACPDETTRSLIAEVSRGWAGRSGGRVVPATAGGREQDPDERADVWVLPAAQLPRWAAGGRLEPMPEELTAPNGEFAWSDLLSQYREHLLRWEGVAYALPLLGDAPVCF